MSAELRVPSRLVALDGLRALAALIVVFAHASYAIAKSKLQALTLFHSPLGLFVNASGAIHVFFVLSGYCLTASALRGTSPAEIAQFYLRRVARIHGPYVAAAAIAWMASAWLYPAPHAGVSDWMRDLLARRLSPSEFTRVLLFPGMVGGLLPQGWTLRVEMIFSLLLPFLVALAARTHWSVLVLVSLAALGVSESFSSSRFALDFSLGIALFLERDRLAAALARARFATAISGVAGVWLLWLPMYALLEATSPRISTVVSAVGATLLLIAAANGPGLRRFLSWRPVAALGRVSYSIYLLHFTVLVLLTPLLDRPVGLAGGTAFAVVVALATCAVAPIGYRAIEQPCIRAGNAVCAVVARRTGVSLRAARAA